MRTGPSTAPCMVCGGQSSAVWHGHEALPICHSCAVEALPALVADAIALPLSRGAEVAKGAVREFELNFWRALCLRLLAKRQPKPAEVADG